VADPGILSEPEAAAALRVSAKTLARWRTAGKVSYNRTPGGRIRYTWDDLLALRISMRVSSQVPVCPHMSGESDPSAA